MEVFLMIWGVVQILLILFVLYACFTYFFKPRATFGNISSRWCHAIPRPISTADFYKSIEDAIKSEGMPNVHFRIVEYARSRGIFSLNQKYLEIVRGDQIFLICAASFAKSYFVSWTAGEKLSFLKEFLTRIPTVGKPILSWLSRKTFYQLDSDSIFNKCIQECVNNVIAQLAEANGVRGLTEFELRPSIVAGNERFI